MSSEVLEVLNDLTIATGWLVRAISNAALTSEAGEELEAKLSEIRNEVQQLKMTIAYTLLHQEQKIDQ